MRLNFVIDSDCSSGGGRANEFGGLLEDLRSARMDLSSSTNVVEAVTRPPQKGRLQHFWEDASHCFRHFSRRRSPGT